MEIFYTKTYNYLGENQIKQSIVADYAEQLGYRELSFFRFPDSCDSDSELNIRMDGIFSSFTNGAALIFQYPSMVSIRYDESVVYHTKMYKGTKLIIWVEDLGSLTAPGEYPGLAREIALFNSADLLILPGKSLEKYLKEHGLHDIPILYQQIWDYSCKAEYTTTDSYKDYANLIQTDLKRENYFLPVMAGFYLNKKIPIVVSENNPMADIVRKYHFGYVTEYLDKPIISDLELVRKDTELFQSLIFSGLFTKELLLDAIKNVILNRIS